jgi:hypothetical protein
MDRFKLNDFYILMLISIAFSCGVPIPTDRTSVYAARETGFHRFSPVLAEKYQGDIITVSNYLIANARTGSYFSGIKSLDINEDSVFSEIINEIHTLDMKIDISNKRTNILDPDIIFVDKHSWNKRIENNVFKFVSEIDKMEGKLNLIPTIIYRLDHDASSFNGPGDVKVRYSIFFIVFIFNERKELVLKDGSGIRAKSESIEHWEEALAFPIEARVTEAHFEEMIREALRDYLE